MAFEFNYGVFDFELLHDPRSWQHCSGPSLRGHIANVHLGPAVFAEYLTMPFFDIDVATHRNIGMGWIVKKALEGLVLPNDALKSVIDRDAELMGARPLDVETYRHGLASMIRLIGDAGLADIPWSVVDYVYPGASGIDVRSEWPEEDEDFAELLANEPEFGPGYYQYADPYSGRERRPQDFVVDISL